MIIKYGVCMIDLDDIYLIPTVSFRFRRMGKIRRFRVGLTLLRWEIQVYRLWADISPKAKP